MFEDHWTGQSRVRAVLGPTNTGKTYTAIQRMLGHRNGIFGLPLRLLAREVYDRVVALKGPEAVALITGEEKIVPRKPRYYICTTESMPQELPLNSLRSMRSNWPPIHNADTFSPTESYMLVEAEKPCFWAPRPLNRYSNRWFQILILRRSLDCRSYLQRVSKAD